MKSASVSHRLPISATSIVRSSAAKGFIVTNLVNIRYITGMQVSAGLILILPKEVRVYFDGRYFEQAKKQCQSCTVLPVASFREDMKRLKRCAFEADDVTVARLRNWQKTFPRITFKPTQGIIQNYRRQKNPSELQAIRKACRITKTILRSIPKFLYPGMSELELAWEIRSQAAKLGAHELAFESIVAFGKNTSSPHHHPTHTAFKKGDIVQIDMGVKIGGYCSDYSRVFFTSDPTPAQMKAMKALLEAKKAAEAIIKPGIDVRTLDRASRHVLRRHGYTSEFCHSLGHGLGLEIHEGVILSQKSKKTLLRKNEVITIEPGLYFEGEWGMRVEDTVIV